MTREREFRELVADVPPEEAERLRRAHELLLAAGPVPELPPGLAEPTIGQPRARERDLTFRLLPRRGDRRRTSLALAAVVALVAFAGGYIAGSGNGGETASSISPVQEVTLRSKSDRRAVAFVEVGKQTAAGNVPMLVKVTGLPPLPPRGYYTLALTKRGKPVVACGTFRVESKSGITTIRMAVGYDVRWFDGWVVTEYRHGRKAEPVVLAS